MAPQHCDVDRGTVVYPDVILAGALDSMTLGNPGIGFESTCIRGTQY